MAATSIAFNATDPGYAANALNHAKQLYDMATQMSPINSSYCNVIPCFEGLPYVFVKAGSAMPNGAIAQEDTYLPGGYRWKAFLSSSVYDDLAWAAIWLYKATGMCASQWPCVTVQKHVHEEDCEWLDSDNGDLLCC